MYVHVCNVMLIKQTQNFEALHGIVLRVCVCVRTSVPAMQRKQTASIHV